MDAVNKEIMELLALMTMRPSTEQIILSLAVALGLAFVMWFAYWKANTKITYQPRFAVTLITLALLSTILMDLIQSNLALSLGMLGSLSIVRFRTNIKDPRDIGFIFWAMSIGLAASTGSYMIGLVGSVVVGAAMILTAHRTDPASDMMLVVRGSQTNLDHIGTIVTDDCTKSRVKAKNIMSDSFELVYEVSIPMQNSNSMIKKLFDLEGIDTVNLLAAEKTMS